MPAPIPHRISTQRTYEGRITQVYRRVASTSDPVSGAAGQIGGDTEFTYDAIGVDTPDYVEVKDKAPFRRIIKSDLADRPQIVSASLNSPCRIDLDNGTPRLIDVLEQYIVEDCAPSDPEPTPIVPTPIPLPEPPEPSLPID